VLKTQYFNNCVYWAPSKWGKCTLRIQTDSVLLTGHNSQRRHLCLLGLLDTPMCRKCGVGQKTSAHILCEWQALASLRHAYLDSFFLEPEDIRSWGPSGTIVRLRGSHDSIWGTKGPSKSRPRCIGAERPWTQMQINQSVLLCRRL